MKVIIIRPLILCGLGVGSLTAAFLPQVLHQSRRGHHPTNLKSAREVDAASVDQINGKATKTEITAAHRYSDLLAECGLDESDLPHVRELPSQREVRSSGVFCNRELKMKGIKAVGFDMDYTLAQYKEPAFDKLAFDGAKQKLVDMGYPQEVLDFEYDQSFWARGLIIDTERGNFLKIDRHKYVRVARHGFDDMSSETRKYLYSRTFNKVMSFSEKSFVNMGR